MRKQKKYQIFIVSVVIVILIFQPFTQPKAQASLSLKELLINFWKFVFKGLKMPNEILFTKEGDLYIGKYRLLKCIGERIGAGKCNPFQDFVLSTDQQVDLYDDQGRVKIVRPKVPDICSLRIVPPPEEQYLSREERLVLAKACTYLRRIQRAATMEAFLAKRIYNQTDPLSECFFARNCRSKCFIGFGTISYTITAFDVAKFLGVPQTWILYLQKFVKLVKEVRKLYNTAVAIKTAFEKGIKNFWAALSDAGQFLFTFKELFPIAIEDIQQGNFPFQEILGRFSENLSKFSQTKSESISLAQTAQQDVLNLANQVKTIESLEFLFGENSQKKEVLSKILNDYLFHIQSPAQAISQLQQATDFAGSLRYIGLENKAWKECPEGKVVKGLYRNPGGVVTGFFCESFYSQRKNSLGANLGQDLDEDSWAICPPGTFVDAIQKDGNSYTNKIDCHYLVNSTSSLISHGECEDLDVMKKGKWNRCPKGTYITALYKDASGKLSHVKCCPLLADPVEIEHPQEKPNPSSCYIESSTVPKGCEVLCRENINNCEVNCPGGEYEITFDSFGNNYRVLLKNPETSCEIECSSEEGNSISIGKECGSQFPYDCYVDCPEEQSPGEQSSPEVRCETSQERCKTQNLGEQSFSITCSQAHCFFSYPLEFGRHQSSCTSTIDNTQINPGEINVVCPVESSFYCLEPKTDWYSDFKNFATTSYEVNYYVSQHLSRYLNIVEKKNKGEMVLWDDYDKLGSAIKNLKLKVIPKLENLSFFIKPNLINKINALPKITTISNADLPYATGSIELWKRSQKMQVNAIDFVQLQNKAAGMCGYPFSLFYENWEKIFDIIQKIDINLIKNGLENYLKNFDLNNDDLDYSVIESKSKSIHNFLTSPLINYEIEKTIKEELEGSASSSVVQLKENLTEIKNIFKEINDLWSNNKEALSALKYMEILKGTKEKSHQVRDFLNECKNLFSSLNASNYPSTASLIQKIDKFLGNYDHNSCSCNSQIGDCNQPEQYGFLDRIQCFEKSLDKTHKKTIEEIYEFVKDLTELEDTVAKEFEDIKSTIEQIKPFTTTLPSESLQRQFPTTFEDFKKLFTDPYETVKDLFDKINSLLTDIENRVNNLAANSPLKDLDELPSFSQKLEEISQEAKYLREIVFGNQELEGACMNVHLVLNQNPADIEQMCNNLPSPPSVSGVDDLNQACISFNDLESIRDELGDDFEDLYKVLCISPSYTSFKENYNCDFLGEDCSTLMEDIKNIFPYRDFLCDEKAEDFCSEESAFAIMSANCETYDELKAAIIAFNSGVNDSERKKSCDNQFRGNNETQKRKRNRCEYFVTDIFPKLINHIPQWTGSTKIPDFISEKERLEELRTTCSVKITGLKKPFIEIMDVYGILLGIKSFTFARKEWKQVKQDFKKLKEFYQKAKAFVKNFKENFEKFKNKLKEEEKPEDKGGLNIELLRCDPQPAFGWRNYTGPNGGPVCPDIQNLFNGIEANFSLIRQLLVEIEMLRRKKDWLTVKLGPISYDVLYYYPIKYDFYELRTVLDTAKKIKKRAQDLWAFATAINFAAQNCTCGQSKCNLPFCISGLPLVTEPITNPFCYIVYMFRGLLLKHSEVLENVLK